MQNLQRLTRTLNLKPPRKVNPGEPVDPSLTSCREGLFMEKMLLGRLDRLRILAALRTRINIIFLLTPLDYITGKIKHNSKEQ